MHDRAGVVLGSQVVNLPQIIFQKVILHALLDVVPVDGDVVIPVSPALLMPETTCMHQLMHHNSCKKFYITSQKEMKNTVHHNTNGKQYSASQYQQETIQCITIPMGNNTVHHNTNRKQYSASHYQLETIQCITLPVRDNTVHHITS